MTFGSMLFRGFVLSSFLVALTNAECYSVGGYTAVSSAVGPGYEFPLSGESCPDDTLCFANELVFESSTGGGGKKGKKGGSTTEGYSEYIGGTPVSAGYPPAYGSEFVINTDFAYPVSAYGTTTMKAPSHICDGNIIIHDMLNLNLNTGSYGCLQIIQEGTDGCEGVYGEFRVAGKLVFQPVFGCEGCIFDGEICLD